MNAYMYAQEYLLYLQQNTTTLRIGMQHSSFSTDTHSKSNSYSLSLVFHHWVIQEVTKINSRPFLDHLRMFSAKEPADVSEEEPSCGVVWIGLGLRVLVVNPVVS